MDTLPLVSPEQVGLSAARLARVSQWMKDWVDSGRLPGMVTCVMRKGELAFAEAYGKADVERNKAVRPDTIFRIYSMTKPLTSTAIMMLYEEGRFQLDDPISRFLPAFKSMRVFAGGSRGKIESVPAEREITFRDLLTHTSGLTYGFMESNPVDALYRAKDGVDFQTAETSLAEVVDKLATFPLIAQPGKAWNYSVSTDVLGRLVEVIAGEPFEKYLVEKVIRPLGMVDTDFHVPKEKHGRFAANYSATPEGKLSLLDDPAKSRYLKPRKVNSGGGGLVSTAADYLRFCKFMLNKGELDGVRLLGRKTVELMTMNHLNGDMADMGTPRFSESTYYGIGFGLGFSVMIDPAKAHIVGTPGEYAWGGAASTAFWCDPMEDMAVVLLTQLMPSSTYPIRRELRVLAYQAIVD
ncbi:serine hydrolase domain-containing protein [Enhydrobacter sp.]|jgi:CubicO group peptidase (beta-lactamase class C family)|uniref:serine hydrolase domain-containing protein n=1 Tax=Enhydrobacter sp. TaxID=1894999 RepID=UPI00260A86D2|nr:serine hydrolase domain-containing protein [Enhydrobacter sp.]WIM10101.1 MAG: Beta-lactamase class C-like and penicillin binding proteins (PBPs) superfamily [Enhydrobacter sp.]